MKKEKHTQFCEHIAEILNNDVEWTWDCKQQRTLSMTQIEERIETLNWFFWHGKDVGSVIRSTDIEQDDNERDVIVRFQQQLAEYALPSVGNIIFSPIFKN